MTSTFITRRTKTTLGLALALGALTPAAASARYELNPVGPATTAAAVVGPAVPGHHVELAPVHMPAETQRATPAVHVTTAGGGFDWADAGIGAAGGVVLSMLVVGGGRIGLRYSRRPQTPARSPAH